MGTTVTKKRKRKPVLELTTGEEPTLDEATETASGLATELFRALPALLEKRRKKGWSREGGKAKRGKRMYPTLEWWLTMELEDDPDRTREDLIKRFKRMEKEVEAYDRRFKFHYEKKRDKPFVVDDEGALDLRGFNRKIDLICDDLGLPHRPKTKPKKS